MKDLIQETRDKFLNAPISSGERSKQAFDLEVEFAKSAKNRSLLVPLAVAGFLVLLGIGAWMASQFTERASQQSSVNIGSFEDLKLKEIFDTARKNKKALEAVQAEINVAVGASNARVAALQQAGKADADVASVNDPTGAQAQAILAETAKKVAAEKASLAATLAPLKAKAEAIQKDIDSYDDRIGQMNKKNQQLLDSQQRLFDLQKKQLTDEYEGRLRASSDEKAATVAQLTKERNDYVAALKEKQANDIRQLILKYNPIVSDPILAAQLAALGATPASYPSLELPPRMAATNVVPPGLQTSLAAKVDRARQLLAKLQAIPYENSVPPLLNVLDNAIADALQGYNNYLVPLDDRLATLEATVTDQASTIATLKGQVSALEAGWDDEKAARASDRLAAEAALVAERDQNAQTLARWTTAVDELLATLKDPDGVIVDARSANDLLVVLKPDRAGALASTTSSAVVRDRQWNGEVASVTVERDPSGTWKAKLVKLSDPKRPIRAFDNLVLVPPAKR